MHITCKSLNKHVLVFQRILSPHPTALRLSLWYSPNWPGTCCIDQANLELTVTFRLLLFEGCDCMCILAHLPRNPQFDEESQSRRTRPLKMALKRVTHHLLLPIGLPLPHPTPRLSIQTYYCISSDSWSHDHVSAVTWSPITQLGNCVSFALFSSTLPCTWILTFVCVCVHACSHVCKYNMCVPLETRTTTDGAAKVSSNLFPKQGLDLTEQAGLAIQ